MIPVMGLAEVIPIKVCRALLAALDTFRPALAVLSIPASVGAAASVRAIRSRLAVARSILAMA